VKPNSAIRPAGATAGDADLFDQRDDLVDDVERLDEALEDMGRPSRLLEEEAGGGGGMTSLRCSR